MERETQIRSLISILKKLHKNQPQTELQQKDWQAQSQSKQNSQKKYTHGAQTNNNTEETMASSRNYLEAVKNTSALKIKLNRVLSGKDLIQKRKSTSLAGNLLDRYKQKASKLSILVSPSQKATLIPTRPSNESTNYTPKCIKPKFSLPSSPVVGGKPFFPQFRSKDIGSSNVYFKYGVEKKKDGGQVKAKTRDQNTEKSIRYSKYSRSLNDRYLQLNTETGENKVIIKQSYERINKNYSKSQMFGGPSSTQRKKNSHQKLNPKKKESAEAQKSEIDKIRKIDLAAHIKTETKSEQKQIQSNNNNKLENDLEEQKTREKYKHYQVSFKYSTEQANHTSQPQMRRGSKRLKYCDEQNEEKKGHEANIEGWEVSHPNQFDRNQRHYSISLYENEEA